MEILKTRIIYTDITKEQLLIYEDKNIIDVKQAMQGLNVSAKVIKNRCRSYNLNFQMNSINNRKTIQCPCQDWSGNFKFQSHILNSQNDDHKQWLQNLIQLYYKFGTCSKVADLEEIKKYNISKTVIKTILGELKIFPENKANFKIYKCPVLGCNWQNKNRFPKHLKEMNDDAHNNLKKDIIKKYLDEKCSLWMISEFYKTTPGTIKHILKNENIKFRTLQESVHESIKHGRHNINGYGIYGRRKDLSNEYYRCMNEANFARILNYEKVPFKHEIPFKLIYPDGTIHTYWLDFLFENNQGIETKSFLDKNGNYENQEKIEIFKKSCPEYNLKVLFFNGEEWKNLIKRYSKLIPLWESRKQNLDNRPDLYKVEEELKKDI